MHVPADGFVKLPSWSSKNLALTNLLTIIYINLVSSPIDSNNALLTCSTSDLITACFCPSLTPSLYIITFFGATLWFADLNLSTAFF